MTVENYQWISAYNLKTIRAASITFFWIFKPGVYEIYFEETCLMTFEGDKGQAERLVAQLNGAYNLGRSSAMIEAEFQKESSNDPND